MRPLTIVLLALILSFCRQPQVASKSLNQIADEKPIVTGAEQINDWLHLVEGKKVGILANHTAVVGRQHLVDTLINSGVNVVRIFVPEHGFRGDADAGELINDGIDAATGIPIVSLYGNNKKPTIEQMKGLDILIFDIQDVGVRFYTYISSLHYLMEACAENSLPLIVLDRPNPNGDYFDGPVLKPEFKSFVGMHPIPIVHGLTVGELAQMINGEGWLEGQRKCSLTIIEVANYTKDRMYSLPIPPSPNLPNDLAIRLYPSLCLFEATKVSIGRGTYFPFQVIGYPDSTFGDFSFTPKSIPGMAKSPLQEGIACFGEDLRGLNPCDQIFTLKYFMKYFELSGSDKNFTSNRRWFNLLAGNDTLLKQIESGLSEDEIRASWNDELEAYDQMRQPYLIYK
jgi:uncharacterized protein YbbC (DUF1343 family)